jgi:hypothetical protein
VTAARGPHRRPVNGAGSCFRCEEEVTWAWTVNGKMLALNPAPDENGNQAAHRDVRGAWVTRQVGKNGKLAGFERRYMPHVATCPQRQRKAANAMPRAKVIPVTRKGRGSQ